MSKEELKSQGAGVVLPKQSFVLILGWSGQLLCVFCKFSSPDLLTRLTVSAQQEVLPPSN